MIGAPGIHWRWRRAFFEADGGGGGESGGGGDGGDGGNGGGAGDNAGGVGSGGGDPDSGPGGPEGGNGPGSGPAGGPGSSAGGGIGGMIDAVLDFIGFDTNKPPEQIAAETFSKGLMAAIPGAGVLSLGVDLARAAGLDVQDAGPPDASASGRLDDDFNRPAMVFSPYRATILAPAPAPGMPGAPDPNFPFLPVGNPAAMGLQPSAAALAALAAAQGGGGASGPAETPSDSSLPDWVPLVGLAAIFAGVAFA